MLYHFSMSLFFTIPAFVWLILSALLFACGEYLSKKFALAPSASYVLLVVTTYCLGALAWLPAILQKNQLSITGALWSVLSLLATVLIGTMIFGEKLGAVGLTGVIFAFIAIALLSMA